MEEGAEAEFKGHGDQYDCLGEASPLFNTGLKEVLRNVCGFLNTGGGSLWFGVHDSGVVQGMPLTSVARDRIELKIRTTISQGLQPLSWDYIAIRWHAVEDDPLVPSVPSPAAPSVPSASSSVSSSSAASPVVTKPVHGKAAPPVAPSPADLSTANSTVKDRLQYLENLLLREARLSDLVVLEICVLPSRVAHFWDLRAYYRNGNQTVTMPVPMLKNKIRSEPPSNSP